ncbi:MAG: glutamate-5-semialdehyde dehydrogenase [Clostridia bacterium]|nr:glutamate-5-semialdehyde dehydrogenase [Clostridia bacterium]
MKTTLSIMQDAKIAAPSLGCASSDCKNKALAAMADALIAHTDTILSANTLDMEAAQGKISPVMQDRLKLDEKRILAMADGIRAVAKLPDPVGRQISEYIRPDGLKITKTAVPLGVIAIIYESRPNVTSDAAALCIKSGNACILRSGKDAFRSAKAITEAMQAGLAGVGLNPLCVQLVEDTSRDSSYDLMRGVGYIDLLIPRGGAGLIRACVENALVPCIETGTGICHIYIDRDADTEMALSILENAKTSRPSVCNAAEVCLVDRAAADRILPLLANRLIDKRIAENKTPVTLRASEEAIAFLPQSKYIKAADDKDFDTEFLDYTLAVSLVDGVAEAVAHITKHSTHHSESIITANSQTAAQFAAGIDSAAVYINASTRFTDGGEFGLGCEMGISTQKLHARGPMGLAELCTYKYIITGEGHIR